MDKFRFLEHTADLKFEAFGNTLEELFENAARAMFSATTKATPNPDNQIEMEIGAGSREELLHDWLQGLLYKFITEDFLPSEYELSIEDNKLKAKVGGITFSGDVDTEVKAVTYHDLKVEKEDDGWHCVVVCDT